MEIKDNKRRKVGDEMLKICTHSGSFHADESLAVYMIKLLPRFKNSTLVRSRKPEDWEASDIVIDVGGQYDGKKFFDHHQRDFNETFSSNFSTKLSSAGLIYRHFGKEIISRELELEENSDDVGILYQKIYKEFIEALDANDNGINNYPMEVEATKKFNDKNITLPALVSHLNPSWISNPSDNDFDAAFLKSSELMGLLFISLLHGYGKSWLPAKEIVKKAFDSRFNIDKSGMIIQLDSFCPWKEHLYSLEKESGNQNAIKFVLFLDSSGKWRVSTVPITSTSFNFRHGLPDKWRGLRDEGLSKCSGIDGCIFVHASGFIGGAETRDAVLGLARIALKS